MLYNSPTSLDIFMRQLQKREPLTREGEVFLVLLAQSGQVEARNELIESNMRFVISIAKKYRKNGIPFLELIQEGSIGLVRAIEKFDPNKGFRFSTYASWWIVQAMTRNLSNKARMIRVPVHMMEISMKVWRICKLMSMHLGHEPSEEEVAEYLELPLNEVHKVFLLVKNPLSLDMPVGGNSGEEHALSDFVEDEGSLDAVEKFEKSDDEIYVRRCLRSLSPHEETVLRLRYGVGE